MELTPYSGQTKQLSPALLLLMSVSCGLAIANLYYNQPLLADMGRTFGLDDQHSGIISMLTQIGFAVGMFLFIPLGDIFEKRKLVIVLLLAGSRLNTVYMVSSFLGGSIGSACGAAAWSQWGWFGACAVGGGMAAMSFLVWLAHRLTKRE